VAKQRVQTQYASNQVRLSPQASPVNTFVQPARNDQISKALDNVTGIVQQVQVKEERKLDMIQASKKQAAQASFNIGYKSLIEQEKFARMSPEQILESPEYQDLLGGTLGQVDDEDLRGVLNNSISQTVMATNKATSANWQRQDLREAGATFASKTLEIYADDSAANYNLSSNPDGSLKRRAFDPDGLTDEQLKQETVLGLPSHIADIESILKEKYGYSNGDLQEFWLLEQERRGEEFSDTLIGDYLLESGFGGPDFRNKVLALNEKANTKRLGEERIAVTDDLMRWKGLAGAGKLDTKADLEARKALKDGLISQPQYMSIVSDNQVAIAKGAASSRKQNAMSASVASVLQGNATIGVSTWTDHNGVEQTISQADVNTAVQIRIKEMAEAKFPDGNAEGILAAQIAMYSNVDVINEQWLAQAGTAFDSLGTGDFTPESPQFKSTMQKFQFLKQLHAGNPQMFKKYLKSTQQRAMFTEWRVMSAYGNSEQDSLRAIGSADHLAGKAGTKDLQAFADDVVKNLDTWTSWDDVAGDDEQVKTLFKSKMVEYAKVIAKYTNMNPKQVVDNYMEEVKRDHSVVNGKLVFMGGNNDIDNNQFQADAQAYIENSIGTIANGAFNADQVTLRHTGRGDTFWIVDQAGRVLPTAPLHLKSFYNLAATQELTAKQKAANATLERKAGGRKAAR